jgi:glutathione S-transferase
MPYHLYITNKNYSSWSLRPWLLLRQLGIPFIEEFRPLTCGSIRQPRTCALQNGIVSHLTVTVIVPLTLLADIFL